MKELNLSIYTKDDGESKVTMTVTFASHTDAVAFHDGIADLCKRHSAPVIENTRRALIPWQLRQS